MALDDEWEIVGLQDDDARPGAWDESPKNANTSMAKHQVQTGSAALEEQVKLSPVTPDERTIEDCIAMQRSQHQHIQYLIRQAEDTEHRLEDNQRLIMDCGPSATRARWKLLGTQREALKTIRQALEQSQTHLEWLVAATSELEWCRSGRIRCHEGSAGYYLSTMASTWCSGAKEETQTGRLCRLQTRRTGALRRTGMHGKMARGSTLRLEAPSTWYSGEEWTAEWEGRG